MLVFLKYPSCLVMSKDCMLWSGNSPPPSLSLLRATYFLNGDNPKLKNVYSSKLTEAEGSCLIVLGTSQVGKIVFYLL